ncbi:MAG: hypothetical protein JST42_23125 [Bacteroidetes bacterium]|nr:hypothetical protein [Bacteroidota bacterium]
MNYLEFRKALLPFQVFSTRDIEKNFPAFDSKRLVEWQRKKYIQKIVNKWYVFNEVAKDEQLLYRISNCICQPSYVSLESAFAYYHLIPEAVYTQKAITTKKTIAYRTAIGAFDFRNIKPVLFFGYTIHHKDQLPILMAEMEKAILDYLYLNSSVRSMEDVEALRFNREGLSNGLDWAKLEKYRLVFESKALDKRVNILKSYLKNANAI